MKFASIFLSAALTAALSAGAANAQGMVSAGNPQTVIDQLQSMGYKASYEPYESGRPRVLSAIAGINYAIAFYGCLDDMSDCRSMMFSSGFDMPSGSAMATINNWNKSRVYTRAFLDEEEDPYFQMPVVRGQDMSAEDFRRVMNIWEDAVIDFTDEVGFER